MLTIFSIFIFCILLSMMVIYIASKLTMFYGIVDHPGDHKQHDISTPFVGGVGLLVSLYIGLTILVNNYPDLIQQWIILGLCAFIIFTIGLLDDYLHLNVKLRFIIQIIVAVTMVLYGGIILNDLGKIFFNYSVELGMLAMPFTIYAIIGGMNIINMSDGIDGLSGSLSLVSLLLIGVVALVAENVPYVLLISALAGGAIGFLYFNLRYASQSSARVFLGDNGSMLLGFLFAWLLVDLAQGPNSAMTPVTALWLLSIPLMDAVGVMQRRLRRGGSPFVPGHDHLHHIFLRSGIGIKDAVFIIVLLHLFLGILGLVGLYLRVPDFVMMFSFILIYIGYFYLTLHPWNYVPILCLMHTRLKLASVANSGTFFGSYTSNEAESMSLIVSKEIRSGVDFWVRIYKQPKSDNSKKCYAILLAIRFSKDKYTSDEKIKRDVIYLRKRLMESKSIMLRQFTKRKSDKENGHDRRRNYGSSIGGLRITDRRVIDRYCLDSQVLTFEITGLT